MTARRTPPTHFVAATLLAVLGVTVAAPAQPAPLAAASSAPATVSPPPAAPSASAAPRTSEPKTPVTLGEPPKPAVTSGEPPKPAVTSGEPPKPAVTSGEPPKPPGPAPSAHPAAAGEVRSAAARIHDRRVFDILVPRAGLSPEKRAAGATQVLERLLDEKEEPEIRVEAEGDVSVVLGGKDPIIQLGQEDATAAGDVTATVHAEAVASKVRAALRAERQRSAVATTVFGFALLVFSGLIAFLLVRKVSELIERLRAWLDANPGRLPALRVRGIEVVQPAAVRGSLAVTLSAANLVASLGIFYAWVLIALSLFDATRDYSERLTGIVLAPVSALVGRVASALPLLVIALVTVFAVGITLRFVRLFFGSMARGETTVGWLPRDLAEPTSILVRAGIVVVTLVVAAPLITGSDDGTLSRAGVVALVALGLAATPLLACAASGIAVVFGRRLRVGDRAGVGGLEGRVRALTMLEVLLEDDDGAMVHVPHLLGLWHPTRVIGATSLVAVELCVGAGSDLPQVIELLRGAAAGVGGRARVEVIALDGDGAVVRVAVTPRGAPDRNGLFCALAAALRGGGVALGRSRAGREARS